MKTPNLRKWLRERAEATDRKILSAIAEAQTEGAYGFGLMRATGVGAGLYPSLARLEQARLIFSRWELYPGDRPRRRLYFLTATGRQALTRQEAQP